MAAPFSVRRGFALAACALSMPVLAHAGERVTLRNGFDMVCDHRAQDGEKTRLFLDADGNNFLDVTTADIVAVEALASEPAKPAATAISAQQLSPEKNHELSQQELHTILASAGAQRDLDVDLLASVVHAESGGHARAQSRAGAQGLMQLMPGTAHDLGVKDAFAPEQNVSGGTAYLNALLTRYRDNLALALAAYNAGPAAVDRWHGVPPYRETRAYVARIIHEFNQRYAARQAALKHPGSPANLIAQNATTDSAKRQ